MHVQPNAPADPIKIINLGRIFRISLNDLLSTCRLASRGSLRIYGRMSRVYYRFDRFAVFGATFAVKPVEYRRGNKWTPHD